MSLSLVSAFKCGVCSDIFEDENKANKHVVKCLKEKAYADHKKKEHDELEQTKDSIRFEAESLEHSIELIKQKAKQKYGLTVQIDHYPDRLTSVSNTHGAPIGFPTNWGKRDPKLPTSYLGYYGRWEGKIIGKCKSTTHDKHDSTELDCIIGHEGWKHGFNGFHSGTGCPAAEFSIEGYIFVDDFPKWKSAKGIVEMLTRLSDSGVNNFDLLKQVGRVHDRFLKAQKQNRALQLSDLVG